jgi:hypothetical protein
LGFIDSLAHPGGNITGFTFVEFTMFGRQSARSRGFHGDAVRGPAGPPGEQRAGYDLR